jgi:ABC-2 type transport system permease protein
MINLLRAEIYKLLKSKAFYICCLICIAGTLIVGFTYDFLQKNMTPEMLEQIYDTSNSGFNASVPSNLFPDTMDGQFMLSQAFAGNTLQLILAVFVSLFVASEFTTGTIKNMVAKGFSRWKIYFAKLLTVWIASLIMMFVAALSAVLIGTILWGFGDIADGLGKNIFTFFGLQILLCFALTAVFITIAIAVRSNGGSIAINICMIAFAALVTSLLDAMLPDGKTISQYWIQNNIVAVSTLSFTTKQITQSLWISISYLVVFVLLGGFTFQQKDIK